MKFEQVKELTSIIDSSSLSYFEASIDDGYIKMDKSLSRNIEKVEVTSENNKTEKVESSNTISEEIYDNFEYIKSPMVGTFYKAPSKDAEPFIVKGQKVAKGDILCIVEAMKLMNEIVAEFDFEVIDILVNDSDMVEYNQELFKIKKL